MKDEELFVTEPERVATAPGNVAVPYAICLYSLAAVCPECGKVTYHGGRGFVVGCEHYKGEGGWLGNQLAGFEVSPEIAAAYKPEPTPCEALRQVRHMARWQEAQER